VEGGAVEVYGGAVRSSGGCGVYAHGDSNEFNPEAAAGAEGGGRGKAGQVEPGREQTLRFGGKQASEGHAFRRSVVSLSGTTVQGSAELGIFSDGGAKIVMSGKCSVFENGEGGTGPQVFSAGDESRGT